jgi:hypothetical protein
VAASQAMFRAKRTHEYKKKNNKLMSKTLLNGTFGSGAKTEELTYGYNEEERFGLERILLNKIIQKCKWIKYKMATPIKN